jgi:GNAT superfamily N-acetyltransferase
MGRSGFNLLPFMTLDVPAMTVFRTLLPAEAGRYADHLLRLPRGDRRARFMGGMSDDAVRAYVDGIDWAHATILVALIGGEVRAAVELRRDPSRGERAELAITIEPDWQGQGIGSTMVRRAMVLARNRGMGRMMLFCLGDNHRMLRIAGRLDARVTFDCGEVVCDFDLPPADAFSLTLEAMDRGSTALTMMLDPGGLPRAA